MRKWKWWLVRKKLSFLLLFVERIVTVIPSSVCFTGVGCTRDVVALGVK